MPGFPSAAPSALAVGASPFGNLAARLHAYQGERYPLHVGDTWMAPPVDVTTLDLPPDAHTYSPPQGLPSLREALAHDIGSRHALPVDPAHLSVTAGATEALAIAAGALFSPGDEVLILAPHWPLIHGILTWNRVKPVRVDILGLSDDDVLQAIQAHITPRTVGLYVNTPSNPTGRVFSASTLAEMAELARSSALWLLADEVYEHHQFTGEHTAVRTLAPERTISVHSCSKAMGLAGYRVGALVVPECVVAPIQSVRAHASYNTCTVAQHVALAALNGPAEAWISASRTAYERAGRAAARRLSVPFVAGGTFLFVDVADSLDERGLMGLLEDAADRGLSLGSGPGFGDYPTHVRVCFTCAPPDVTERGVDVLAELLGR